MDNPSLILMNSGFSERFGPGDPVQLNQSFNFNSIISSIQRSTQNQHLIFNYLNGSPNHQSDPDGNIKVKRTRQRVDAGQPRSTIPVYNNLMRSAVGTGKGSHPYLTDDMSLFKRANIFGTSDSQRNNSSSPSQHNYMMNQMVSQMNGNSFAPQGKAGSVPEFEPEVVHRNSTPVFSNDVLMTQLLRLQGIMASSAATTECKPNVAMKLDQEPAESPVQSIATDLSVGTWHQNESTPPLSTGSTAESAFHFCAISTSGLDNEVDRRKSLVLAETSPSKSKRKQYLPRSAPQMILENNSGYEIEDNDDVDFTCYGAITGSGEPPRRKQRLHSQDGLLPLTTGQFPAELESLDDVELKVMQQEITDMQQRYMQLLKTRSQKNTANVTTPSQTPGNDRQSGELMSPGFQLNSELITNVESTVDKVVAQYLQMVETARLSLIGAKQTSMELQQTASTYPNQGPHEQLAQSQKNLYLSYYNALALYANATSGFNGLATATAQSTEPNGIFPLGSVAPKSGLIAPIPFGVPTHAVAGSGAVPVSTSASSCFRTRVNSVGALPLLPKNRKSKVTDSRSSKGSFGIPYNLMATSQLSAEETFTQGCDPRFQTRPSISPSGIIASPQSTNSRMELENSDMEGNGLRCVSDGSGSETGSSYLNHSQLTSTLTPTHLRKAKLMFFYVRYPTSQILKSFFPDIRFDKNNTAQLVKWFSNFREFYYIQMEKYARQALAEGIRSSDEITVDVDSELYRVLNVHYNRNNHIQVKVPADFREVVEVTLREFFKSIQANRDAEQSWKKSIYKIIARLDQTIPVYFNTMSFMQQLGFSEQ